MMEFQFHTVELVELRRPRSRLGAAVVRFLRKMAFFAMMFGIGAAGMVWLPVPPDPSPALMPGDIVHVVAGVCVLIMFCGGLFGMGFVVATGGRKPRWD